MGKVPKDFPVKLYWNSKGDYPDIEKSKRLLKK
jgi:hypothetical protein